MKDLRKIRIDTGGTFTDCWTVDPNGKPRSVKILSSGSLRIKISEKQDGQTVRVVIPTNWVTHGGFFVGFKASDHTGRRAEVVAFEDGVISLSGPISLSESLDLTTGEEAPILGARLLTGTGLKDEFPPLDFRLATTRGTNALLERKGAPVALFVNCGFGDLLTIGDQRRPDLFALQHRVRTPMHREVIEIEGRLNEKGMEESPLNLNNEVLKKEINRLVQSGITTAAVALLHSYKNSGHEQALKSFLMDCGFRHVSLSSELAPLIKLLPRTETAVANAYLYPVLQSFLSNIQKTVGEKNRVYTMTSAGGLEPVEVFRPKDSLLSGPAGGVSGAAAIAGELGIQKILTFDMGGTSTDVARYDGDFIYQFEQKVGDAKLLSTALKIETVASGGGSICEWSAAGLRVGPDSAGADPGPACYGKGGPLTITDVNVLLGRIDPDNFGIPLSESQIDAAEKRALELQIQAGLSGGEIDIAFLEGLIEIANEQMADAIRTISIRDGADPAEYALLAFGGAGPLHACAIAEKLRIRKIIVPGEAGVLSAYGLEHSRIERLAEAQVNLETSELEALKEILQSVSEKAVSLLAETGHRCEQKRQIAELRLKGQDAALSLDFTVVEDLKPRFAQEYESIFGYQIPLDRMIEVVSLRVIASSEIPGLYPVQSGTVQGTVVEFSRYIDRDSIPVGGVVKTPCTIQDPFSTFFLSEGWEASKVGNGSLVVESTRDRIDASHRDQPEEVVRELFRHRLDQIVGEMGTMLQRSAISTNVKERLDFSCALLDRNGKLICSAHHIPVHLGALGMCVRMVRDTLPIRKGDTVITNHPGVGGSHLPDVTLITPVFGESNTPIAYLANRAHHAEIGGKTPGSMPPDAVSLAEEGVVISPQYLIEGGVPRFDEIEKLLSESAYPSRRVTDNVADLHAQVAANLRGVSLLLELVEKYSETEVLRQMQSLYTQSATAMSHHLEIQHFEGGESTQRLDDGTVIRVKLTKCGDRLLIDFSGSSLKHPGNLNATPAIVQSAVLYVVRLWTQSSLPLNEGLLEAVEIVLPPSFLNPSFDTDPTRCPAVVGGNVETSQRVVDALVEAFGIQACSQGTMNNFIFGDDSFGYYETIGGGAGAGPGYHGASGLHTHMTNTAITDPEILESRYPVRLNEFSIRKSSGGVGKWIGGDGLVREITFLKPISVSLLTQHRREAPFGMEGGGSGVCGTQFVDDREVDGTEILNLQPGQTLRIETPGGGGFGAVDQ
ncbi:MAG: hydantoinase B/oxoprolinase family protein [Verrucomicrobiales bacterium]|nr:hydantoinase B/oxoprolinase family protein [Verrucomicrobiales bacterium]